MDEAKILALVESETHKWTGVSIGRAGDEQIESQKDDFWSILARTLVIKKG